VYKIFLCVNIAGITCGVRTFYSGNRYVVLHRYLNLLSSSHQLFTVNHFRLTELRLCIILLATASVCTAQHTVVPRDTSYTLHSTFTKIRKLYPDIDVRPVYPNPSATVVTEKDVTYATLESRKLTANMFYPRGITTAALPGVLMIHGGGWHSGDKSLMTPLAERIAQAGYVVMAAEYRLAPEAKYPAAVHDLYAALLWLCRHAAAYSIDVTKLVVLGCSAGGQLAALVGTTYNKPDPFIPKLPRSHGSRIAAVIDIDGVLAFKHPDSREGSMASAWLGGTYEEASQAWTTASALTHADHHTPPTLFLGSMYPRFLAGRQDYINKLEPFGTKTKTLILDQAPHSFWLLHPWFEPTAFQVIGFLDEVVR
jgi:acetyl esterase/lipase